MNANKETFYEWDLETWDLENGDVLDHMHDELEQIVRFYDPAEGHHIVLVKDVWNYPDRRHRTWAYVEDGILPECFDDGTKVPKRFHAEFRKKYSK